MYEYNLQLKKTKQNKNWCLLFVSQEITDMDRDKEAMWLISLRHTFDFTPETFALAISIMDRVSTLVKVSVWKAFVK